MIAHPDRNVNATILLASASPRRRELIQLLGLPVETTAADIDEVPLPGEHAADMAIRLSFEKAQAVLSAFSTQHEVPVCWGDSAFSSKPAARSSQPSSFILHPSSLVIVLASDTVVSLDDEPLGKPRDAEEARSMLRRLRDRTHQVYTAITLIDARSPSAHNVAFDDGSASGLATITDLAASDVRMRAYSDEEIETYVASGDPFDKAGAYAIQHNGFHPVEHFDHCFANVMGLPLCHVVRSLRKLGIEPPQNVPIRCQQYIQYQCPVFEKILAMSDE